MMLSWWCLRNPRQSDRSPLQSPSPVRRKIERRAPWTLQALSGLCSRSQRVVWTAARNPIIWRKKKQKIRKNNSIHLFFLYGLSATILVRAAQFKRKAKAWLTNDIDHIRSNLFFFVTNAYVLTIVFYILYIIIWLKVQTSLRLKLVFILFTSWIPDVWEQCSAGETFWRLLPEI